MIAVALLPFLFGFSAWLGMFSLEFTIFIRTNLNFVQNELRTECMIIRTFLRKLKGFQIYRNENRPVDEMFISKMNLEANNSAYRTTLVRFINHKLWFIIMTH